MITNCSRLPLSCSTPTLPRIFTEPRPVVKYCLMPSIPQTMQPVGKSGPFMNRINCGIVMSGLSIWAQTASIVSPRLCGAMLVAMPTAMPVPPLTNRFGNAAGNTTGSDIDSS